jgi:thioredoxin reductase
MAERDERPYPPGDYPLVVVGSGPGGLQLAYSLSRLNIPHAAISADPGPGGMFRRWPLFQRLLSWTKPYAPGGPGSRAFERLDWNSLIAEEPDCRSLQARHMDGTSDFPSRAEMEANLTDFATRTGLKLRYGCRWESTRREETADGPRYVLSTSDGEYRCRYVIFAVGVAEPWNPPIPGIELAHHYADVRPAESYAGRSVFLIGKHNSGFEIATGLLPWARSLTLASPSPAKLSVTINSLVGVRARYLQPYEDFVLGGGVGVVDGSIEKIERADNALAVTVRATKSGERMIFPVDDAINATGFTCPLRDLPKLGVATFGQSSLPAQTTWWESASTPGIYFAGTITQGQSGLSKHGIPPNSGAVQGYRYNSRVLARHLAERKFGVKLPRPEIEPRRLVAYLLDEATRGPELWHQKGFLARVVTASAGAGVRDEGVIPLAAFLDEGGPDGVALTVEADGTSAIYPVAYVRKNGAVKEHQLTPQPMLAFETKGNADALAAALEPIGIERG